MASTNTINSFSEEGSQNHSLLYNQQFMECPQQGFNLPRQLIGGHGGNISPSVVAMGWNRGYGPAFQPINARASSPGARFPKDISTLSDNELLESLPSLEQGFGMNFDLT